MGGRKQTVTFRELTNPGTPIGLVEPTRPKCFGKYQFWVWATKKTFLFQISHQLLAQALDGFPDDAKAIRKLLADEQKKLLESLMLNSEDGPEPDSPLALLAAADARDLSMTDQSIPEDVIPRIEEVENNLMNSMDALAAMNDCLRALPEVLHLIKKTPDAKKVLTVATDAEKPEPPDPTPVVT